MAISTGDRDKYRGGRHSTGFILNRVPKIPVATMRVNQTAFSYPLANLTVDTISMLGTVKVGHMVLIGTAPGAWDVTTGVVNAPYSGGSILSIDAKSQGDPGWTRNIITPISNNHYITILKYRPPHGLMSSIRNGVFYKRWNQPYNGEGANPSPVVVMGDWLQAWAEPGGVATVSLNASGSWAWGGRTIADRLWNLDGGDVNTGDLDDATLTADFEPGFYELEHYLQDSVGRTRVGYRYLWVNVDDPADDNAPFSYRYAMSITDDKQETNGREIGISFNGNLKPVDELFPSQGFLFTELPEFNGQKLSGDSYVGKFVGYATEGRKVTSFRRRVTDLVITSPLRFAETVPAAAQEINEVPGTPADWSQVTRLLSNPVGAYWYVTAHHAPYLIDGHDFEYKAELLKLRRRTWQFRSTNIAGQIRAIADMIKGVIGERSAGRVRMVRSPMHMSNADRNLLETYWEWLPGDMIGEFQRSFMGRLPISQTYGYAFAFDGSESTPFASLAPGFVRAQGDGQNSITPFTVTPAEGQNRVNDITGHDFAQSIALPPFSIVADRLIDIAEPCDVDRWHVFSVPESYDSEGYGWIDERAICRRVTRNWSNNRGLVKTIQIEFQSESYGVPGITIPVDRGGANNWWINQWNPGLFDYFSPVMPDLSDEIEDEVLPVMLAVNSNGRLARTFTFLEDAVSWEWLGVPAGRVLGFSVKYNSPYFTNPNNALRYYILTENNGSLHAYTLMDARAKVPVFEEFTNSPLDAGDGFKGKAKIKSSRTDGDLVLIAWRNHSGIQYSRATAATPALSAETNAGATVTDVDHDDLGVGMDIVGDYQAIIAPDGGTDLAGLPSYALYAANGSDGFAYINGNPLTDGVAYPAFVATPEDGRALVTYIKPEPPSPPPALGVVTFDPGGQLGYVIAGAGITAAGNPGNCAWYGVNVNGAGGGVAVSVACEFLEGLYDITEVTYEAKQDYIGSITNPVELYFVKAFAGDKLVGEGTPEIDEYLPDGWIRYKIRVDQLGLTERPDTVTVHYGYSIDDSSPGTIIYSYIDNIDITATPVEYETTRVLYSVQTLAEDWNDITPKGRQIPLKTYAVGGNSASLLSMLGITESGKTYILDTSSQGAIWALIGRTPYAGLARAGNIVLSWGYNQIAISPDKGKTFYPRLGDWVAKVGAVGEIVQVGGVL